MSLKISVIIPLLDHRSHALEGVRSWTRKQNLERDTYQLIVVSDDSDVQLNSQIKAMLMPHDEFIVSSCANEFDFYNIGAAQAKGDIIFITESHCLGMPKCLSEAIHFLNSQPNYAGACCGSVGSTDNRFASLEARLVEEILTPRLDNEHWHRVTVRGFFMWREIYQAAGGFEAAHGHFAETALAARLHALGHRLGYARQAMVYHYNTTSLAEVYHIANEYTVGECEYRLKYPAAYCEAYFGHAPEWSMRAAYRPATARRFCLTLLKSLFSGITSGDPLAMQRMQINNLLGYGLIGIFGAVWPLWGAQLSLRLAQWRTNLWYYNKERTFQAYRDFWLGIAHCSRLKFIHQHWSSQTLSWAETFDYDFVKTDDSRLTGFYAIESWQEQPFRWSGPVAMVQVTLPAQVCAARLELLPIGVQERPLHLRLYFNGHQIPASSIKMCNDTLFFHLDPAMFRSKAQHQQLVLICNPLQTGNLETRQLGLAVKGIYFGTDDANLSD